MMKTHLPAVTHLRVTLDNGILPQYILEKNGVAISGSNSVTMIMSELVLEITRLKKKQVTIEVDLQDVKV